LQSLPINPIKQQFIDLLPASRRQGLAGQARDTGADTSDAVTANVYAALTARAAGMT
jgi:hypothetical protein